MKKIALALLAIITIAGIQSCQSTKSATSSKMLKFNFEKGKAYDYEMIINMDQEMGGQKMQMDMTTYYSMNVVDEVADNKIITTTYDRFKMNMKMGPFDIDVDTDQPKQGMDIGGKDPMKMINSILGAIKGRKFTMKVNAEGRIEEVAGLAGMAQAIVDSTGVDEKMKEQMKQEFDKQFNEKNVKEQFERVLYIFPNKEVKVGDTWQKTTTPGGPMGGKYTSTYKVTDIEGDMVTLEENSKIEGLSTEMNMKGTIAGSLVVDSRSGLVVSANQDMNMTINTEGKEVKVVGKTKIKGVAR